MIAPMSSLLALQTLAFRMCGMLHPPSTHPLITILHPLIFISPVVVHLGLSLVFIAGFANSNEVLTVDVACTLTANVVKFFVYIRHEPEFRRLVVEINELSRVDERIQETHARCEKLGRMLLGSFYVIAIACGILLQLDSFIGASDRPELPFKAWYPFDTVKHYKLALTMQVLMVATCNSCVPVMDTMLPAVLLHICVQFDELARALRRIGRRDGRVRTKPSDDESESATELEDDQILQTTTFGGDSLRRRPRVRFVGVQRLPFARLDKESDDEDEAYRRLVECIRWHQRILSLVRDVSTLFSPIIFVQLLSNSVVICLVTFKIAQRSHLDSFLLGEVLYLAFSMMQIGFFCYFGSEVQAKGLAVTTAGYHTRWQQRSVRFRKTLRMLMLRAQHPLVIVGGRFYEMTLHTFVAICRASVSYFSVLRQVVNDE